MPGCAGCHPHLVFSELPGEQQGSASHHFCEPPSAEAPRLQQLWPQPEGTLQQPHRLRPQPPPSRPDNLGGTRGTHKGHHRQPRHRARAPASTKHWFGSPFLLSDLQTRVGESRDKDKWDGMEQGGGDPKREAPRDSAQTWK